MIKSTKLFIVVIVVGIIAIAISGVGAFLLRSDYFGETTDVVEKSGEFSDTLPEPTGKVDDLINSIEEELDEEMDVNYGEDYSDNLLEGDNEVDSLGESIEDIEL